MGGPCLRKAVASMPSEATCSWMDLLASRGERGQTDDHDIIGIHSRQARSGKMAVTPMMMEVFACLLWRYVRQITYNK